MLFCLKGPIDQDKCDKCIVFLHGFLGRSDDWNQYLDHFNQLGFATISIDLPGHGKSSLYELEEFFSVIPQGSHIVGYSMGGRIALQLNRLRKNWFSSLTLISTNPGLKSKSEIEERKKWDERWCEKFEKDSIKNCVDEWYKQSLFSSFSPPAKRYIQNQDLLSEVFRKFSIANLPSLWDHLPKIYQPIQMVFGEVDRKYMKLKKEIENIDIRSRIKLTSIKECSHSVHLEAPELVLCEIDNLMGMVCRNA